MIPMPFGRKDEIFGGKDLRYVAEQAIIKERKRAKEQEEEKKEEEIKLLEGKVRHLIASSPDRLTNEEKQSATTSGTVTTERTSSVGTVTTVYDSYHTISDITYIGQFDDISGVAEFVITEDNIVTAITYYFTFKNGRKLKNNGQLESGQTIEESIELSKTPLENNDESAQG